MLEYYKFIRDGEEELVEPEKWQWIAEYNDGTVLKQFDDETGLFHQFSEIDQSKLDAFRMVSEDNPEGFILVFYYERMKLIHFYNRHIMGAGTPDESRHCNYVFGYETKDEPKRKVLFYIKPDNGLVIADE